MPLRARDLMQADPLQLAPDTPFLEVQHLFSVAQIGGAPVVDADGSVLGIISSIDLLRAVDQACDEDIDAEIEDLLVEAIDAQRGRPERAGSARSGNHELVEHLGQLTAREVATPEVVWVAPDTPITDVAALMQAEGVHRVLVGREGRLAGILTSFDLLKAVRA